MARQVPRWWIERVDLRTETRSYSVGQHLERPTSALQWCDARSIGEYVGASFHNVCKHRLFNTRTEFVRFLRTLTPEQRCGVDPDTYLLPVDPTPTSE